MFFVLLLSGCEQREIVSKENEDLFSFSGEIFLDGVSIPMKVDFAEENVSILVNTISGHVGSENKVTEKPVVVAPSELFYWTPEVNTENTIMTIYVHLSGNVLGFSVLSIWKNGDLNSYVAKTESTIEYPKVGTAYQFISINQAESHINGIIDSITPLECLQSPEELKLTDDTLVWKVVEGANKYVSTTTVDKKGVIKFIFFGYWG